MSLFDYPRINFKGTIQLNPGTANNDDYAQDSYAVLPSGYGKYSGEVLGLIDSKTVSPRNYGMSDEEFIAWVQKAQTFDIPSQKKTAQIIPAEWNYYGDMSSEILSAKIISTQSGPGKVYTQPDPANPATSLIGANLILSGHITDVNSEGSPPATQFFIDSLSIKNNTRQFNAGNISKGACQWLNFYRNVNLTADGGAGGYVYQVIRYDANNDFRLPGFEGPDIIGLVCRYYLYQVMEGVSTNAEIEALYQKKQKNPAKIVIIGTFAPLMKSDRIFTGPVGRLLVSDTANIPTPNGTKNNSPNGLIALAPAVLRQNDNIISVDLSGTFPEIYNNTSSDNPKFDFGPVTLVVANTSANTAIGPVNYTDVNAGDLCGWVFDFDISSNSEAKDILKDPEAVFSLQHPVYHSVLGETDYFFVSNQQAIYAEQYGPQDLFLNQGTTEHATVSVYHRGMEIRPEDCPPITVWQYRSVPIQSPGNVIAIDNNFKPGQTIKVDTGQPGNFLFTFSIPSAANPQPGFPPQSYNAFSNPPFVTNAPSVSLRILPNYEDFSVYYIDPASTEPVGNDLLSFDVVYQKVLRTYYLLYPVMNSIFQLNSEKSVMPHAARILSATDPASWMSIHYMPRTRDMSQSRRTLLQAWCRKVLKSGNKKI